MKENIVNPAERDPFGLRKLDFSKRVPEKSEMFSREEALTYIQGCDFPESADDLLLAWEIEQRFGSLNNKVVLDTMCGPGRLGRELLNLGAHHVVFHDGDILMSAHARTKAAEIIADGQKMHSITAPVDKAWLPKNMFDLIVCHNSTHQLESIEKLQRAMENWLRMTKPGGFIMIADYQRDTSSKFINSLEERLTWTKEEIVPLLKPTFMAAFSKEEWQQVLELTFGISSFLVTDATLPELTPEMQTRIDQDQVKGHVLDFSPISLRVIAQKGGI